MFDRRNRGYIRIITLTKHVATPNTRDRNRRKNKYSDNRQYPKRSSHIFPLLKATKYTPIVAVLRVSVNNNRKASIE